MPTLKSVNVASSTPISDLSSDDVSAEDPMIEMLRSSKEAEAAIQEAAEKQEDRLEARHSESMSVFGAQTGALKEISALLVQNQKDTTAAFTSMTASLGVQSDALAMLLRNQPQNRG